MTGETTTWQVRPCNDAGSSDMCFVQAHACQKGVFVSDRGTTPMSVERWPRRPLLVQESDRNYVAELQTDCP